MALLVTIQPPVMAVGCVAGSAPSHGSHVSSTMPEHAHDGPECQAVVTCSAAMIEPLATPEVAQPATPPLLHPRLSAVAPATPVMTADPPPPRRIA
jgi:hypothetical protein